MPRKKNSSGEEVVVAVPEVNVGVARRAMDTAIKQLRKQHGDDVVAWMATNKKVPRQIISTGSLSLDAALVVGGIVRGRIYELFGPESGGKTTLALSIIREAQIAGGSAIFVDAEHALDEGLVEKMGLDFERIALVRGYTGEQNLDIADNLMRTGAFDVCVIDSVAALQPTAEANLQSFGDNTMGLHPRLMSRLCRTFTPLASRTQTAFVLINQVRSKMSTYGNSETTAGGNALRHHMSGRIRVSGGGTRSRNIMDAKGYVIGHRVALAVVKNKLGPPFREAEVDLIYGKGFHLESELLDFGVGMGLIDQAGSWFSVNDRKIGQGRVNAVSTISEDSELRGQLLVEVRRVLGIGKAVDIPALEEPEESDE